MTDADQDPARAPDAEHDATPAADPAADGGPRPIEDGEGVFGPRLGIRSLRRGEPRVDDPAGAASGWNPVPPPPPSAWSAPGPLDGPDGPGLPPAPAAWEAPEPPDAAEGDVPWTSAPTAPPPTDPPAWSPGGTPEPAPWTSGPTAPPPTGPPAGLPPAPPAPPASAAPPAGLPPSGLPQTGWQPPTLGGWGAPAPAPTPPPGRQGAHPLLLAGVAALVIAAVAVAGGVLLGSDDARRAGATDEPEIEHPDEWDPRVEPLVEWVADERDLGFLHPVAVEFLPEDEYLEQAELSAGDVGAEELDALDDVVGMWRALGLVQGEVDLVGATGDLRGAGTLASYDHELDVITVRGTELTPSVRATLVHELTHVLQDQHFDLSRLSDPDDERSVPLRAIAEGDAGRIEDAYVAEVLTADERAGHLEQSASDGEVADADLADVPPALVTTFAAPYVLGEGFVTYQERVEGAGVIDDLLEDPPTEEELMDPAVRATSRAVVRDVLVEVPSGVDLLDDGPVGPLTWFLFLASQRDPAQALAIVDGWGGDHFIAYRDDDRVCVAAAVAGDDGPATDRLHVALATWADAAPGEARVSVRDGVVQLVSCDPGPDATPVGEVTPELLAVPYVRAEVESTLRAQGATPERARCATGRLLAAFSVEELADPTLAGDPAVQERVAAEVGACA